METIIKNINKIAKEVFEIYKVAALLIGYYVVKFTLFVLSHTLKFFLQVKKTIYEITNVYVGSSHLLIYQIQKRIGLYKKVKVNIKRKITRKKLNKIKISPQFYTLRPIFVLKQSIIQLAIFSVLTLGLIFYYSFFFTLPPIESIESYRPKQTTYIYADDNTLLYKTYKLENRTIVDLKDVPPHLVNALISIEDSDFRTHLGISPFGIVRAAYANYKNNEITQGASTITQQLIKNTLLTSERTWERKIKEIILAVQIEQKYTKDQILELYLNTIPLGSTAYGVEEASLMYFKKHVDELDLAESSLLAGLPVAPTKYNPYTNFEATKARQKQVLIKMVKDEYITLDEALAAYEEKVNIFYPTNTIEYPHFVYYVTDYLESKYGSDLVNHGGLRVHTTINPEMQEMAQQIVTDHLSSLGVYNISNGSALITRNKTGEVVAMVGSKDYRATDIDGYVNLTTALRQPGSSVKPFNYSLALNNGMTAASIIRDTPVTYNVPGSEPYSPKNYDGRFRGNVTLRRALANSLNIPAVKVLERNGIDNFVSYVRKFGIDTWNNDYYGLSLALGAAEVRMTQMNQAYAVFANNGVKVNINPIKYIELPNGDILEYNPCLEDKSFLEGRRVVYKPGECGSEVISEENAFIIKSILSDFNARAEAFGSNSILNVPGTAVKTGTTNDMKDNWAFGFNEEYTVGTWGGNNDGTPMSHVASGVTGPSEYWAEIMRYITTEKNSLDLSNIPDGIERVNLWPLTSQLACGSCGGHYEYFIDGTQPNSKCSDRQIRDINSDRSNKDDRGED